MQRRTKCLPKKVQDANEVRLDALRVRRRNHGNGMMRGCGMTTSCVTSSQPRAPPPPLPLPPVLHRAIACQCGNTRITGDARALVSMAFDAPPPDRQSISPRAQSGRQALRYISGTSIVRDAHTRGPFMGRRSLGVEVPIVLAMFAITAAFYAALPRPPVRW